MPARADDTPLRARIFVALLAGLVAFAPPAAPRSGTPPAEHPPPGEMARVKEMIERGELAAARARLEPIVGAHPGWGRATLLLALVDFRENRFESARRRFERAAELDPDEPSGRLFLGWTLFYLGELDEAERSLRSFLAAHGEHAEARLALARVAVERGDDAAARDELARAIALAAAGGDAVVEGRSRAVLAELLAREGKLEAARSELERAAALVPRSAEIEFQLSRVLERLGDAEGARRARERSEALRASAEAPR